MPIQSRPTRPNVPSLAEIREKTARIFGCTPCLWQAKVAEAVLKGDKDVISVAATGSGKTLTFWMPLLFRTEGIQLVITPLNLLGEQNVDSLAKLGINAITVTAENATRENFKAIEEGQYRVVVTNIETVMKKGEGFEKLWKIPQFTSRLVSVVWDEAHCISKWGSFRPEYKEAGRLRYLLPKGLPFVITSATLPPLVLSDVMDILQVSKPAYTIHRSNDRVNVHIVVRRMKHAQNSYKDLAFLIPEGWTPRDPLPHGKFLIFFDSKAESVAAAEYLRGRLAIGDRHLIKWFNADMSSQYRVDEADALKEGQIWGLACTDSFGMGLDLPDIELVIQWRASCDICTLWQRFGRGARSADKECIALFLVEPKYFDDVKQEKAERKAKADAKKRQAQQDEANGETDAPGKRKRTSGSGGSGGSSKRRRVEHDVVADGRGTQDTANGDGEDGGNRDGTRAGEEGSDHPNVDVEMSDSIPQHSAPPYSAFCEERRALYRSKPAAAPTKQKKGTDELDEALEDLINADTRGFACFRLPVTLFFGNDKLASDHMACQPNREGGCPRCIIPSPTICCSLHTPDRFKTFARTDTDKTNGKTRRSRVDDKYEADAVDMQLRNALNTFRRDQTTSIFGWAALINLGPALIMSDEVLHRIVDCAHVHKIRTKEDLVKETQWPRAQEDGDAVLAIVATHRPLPASTPAPTTTPLHPQSMNHAPATLPSTPTPKPSKLASKCGACGIRGHIASNKKCTKHPSRQNAENDSPLARNSALASRLPAPALLSPPRPDPPAVANAPLPAIRISPTSIRVVDRASPSSLLLMAHFYNDHRS